MRRAAIYARYSSELQSAASIDDQFALCRTYCAREGFFVVGEFSDRAMSGASLLGRQGLAELMTRAQERTVDVIVVESLDRLSRSMKDLAALHEELSAFLGVDIVAVHEGRADTIQIGVRGLVGALYLSDLAQKTRRGLAGKLRIGQRAGGLPYGYRPIAGRPGEHEIHEGEAETVRRIFESYAKGLPPRQIAADLNAAGVTPSRGRAWNASTLNGSAKRASGMLANEVYRGVIVWNRVGKVTNPRTGKRVPRINAPETWERVDAPHLRIVDEELWSAVQDRRKERRHGPHAWTRRPTRPFSGLLKCAVCGSGVVSAGSDHGRPIAQCSRVRESGDCSNKRRIYLDTLEAAIFEGLLDYFRRPEEISAYLAEYHAERRRLAAADCASRDKLDRRLAEIDRQILRLVDAIAEGAGAASLGAKIAALEIEQASLRQRLAAMAEPDVVALHPATLSRYMAMLQDLSAEFMGGEKTVALAMLRDLIEAIIVEPREAGEPAVFSIRGRLAALLAPSVGSLVPRGGIEPPTLRFSVACSTN